MPTQPINQSNHTLPTCPLHNLLCMGGVWEDLILIGFITSLHTSLHPDPSRGPRGPTCDFLSPARTKPGGLDSPPSCSPSSPAGISVAVRRHDAVDQVPIAEYRVRNRDPTPSLSALPTFTCHAHCFRPYCCTRAVRSRSHVPSWSCCMRAPAPDHLCSVVFKFGPTSLRCRPPARVVLHFRRFYVGRGSTSCEVGRLSFRRLASRSSTCSASGLQKASTMVRPPLPSPLSFRRTRSRS